MIHGLINYINNNGNGVDDNDNNNNNNINNSDYYNSDYSNSYLSFDLAIFISLTLNSNLVFKLLIFVW